MSKQEKAKQAPPRKEKGKFLKSAAIDAEAKEVMLNVSSSDPTQLHRWLEAMQLEANRLFPHLADIILVKKYPEIKAPEDSHVLYDDINDPSSFFRQTRSAKIKKAVDLEAKLEDAKSSLFSIMLQHMSSNSIQRVKVAVHKIVISNRELAWSNERATRTEAREELKRRQGIRKRMKARAESKTKAKEKAIKKLSDRYDAKRKDALHARKSAQDKRTAYDAAVTTPSAAGAAREAGVPATNTLETDVLDAERDAERLERKARKAKEALDEVVNESTSDSSSDSDTDITIPSNDEDLGELTDIGEYEPDTTEEAWNNFLSDADPLQLLTAIKDSHLLETTGSEIEDRLAAVKKWWELQQRPNQTLERYYRIWNTTIQTVSATGGTILSGKDLVVRFVNSLDPSRYGPMQAEMANNDRSMDQERRRTAYPRSVDEAFVVASHRKEATPVEEYNKHAVPMALVTATASAGGKKKEARGANKKKEAGGADTKKGKEKPSKPPSRPCSLCKELHWTNECPHLVSCQELIQDAKSSHYVCLQVNNAEDALNATATGFDLVDDADEEISTDCCEAATPPAVHTVSIICDNASDVNIFKDRFLLDCVKPVEPITLSGISANGPKVEITHKGEFRGIKDVYYAAGASANILSQGIMEDLYDIEYIPGKSVVIHRDEGDLTFKRTGRKYAMNMDGPYVHAATVTENERGYSKREIKDAREARRLIKLLDYPGRKHIERGIKAGNLNNVKVTVQDIDRSYDIYGPVVPHVRGKATRPQPSSRDRELTATAANLSVKDGTLSVDVMNIEGTLFLVGVLDEVPVTMGQYLTSRSTKIILEAMERFREISLKQGWRVVFRSDNEKAITAIAENLRYKAVSMSVEQVGPGRHVPIVERKIRTIEERCRAVLSSLPYSPPAFFMKWLVAQVISSINMLRDDSANNAEGDLRSPREKFFGRRTDVERDLRIAFGDYAEIYDTNISFINSMKPRTRAAICLGRVGNGTGTVRFWCLSSNRIVKRDSWVEAPLTVDMINHINAEAKRRGRSQLDPLPGEDVPQTTADGAATIAVGGEVDQLQPNEAEVASDMIPDEVEVASDMIPDEAEVASDMIPDEAPQAAAVEDATPQAAAVEDAAPPAAAVEDAIPQAAAVEDATSQAAAATAIEESSVAAPRGTRMQLRAHRRIPARYRHEKELGSVYNIKVSAAITKFGKHAIKAIVKELVAIQDYGTMQAVNVNKIPKSQLKKILRSSMFLKEKYLASGEFEKLKARLVAGGNTQDRSLYTDDETSSPTVSTSALFALTALAAKEKRIVTTIDIKSAYLNASIDTREILMRIEPSLAAILLKIEPKWSECIDAKDGSLVVKLRKALYGCVESARLFYEHLKATLSQAGYTPSKIDPCVFYKRDSNGKMSLVLAHVDDLMILSADNAARTEVVDQLQKVYKSITVHDGHEHNYLGMTFDFSKQGKVAIRMAGYVDGILQDHQVSEKFKTPANVDLFKVNHDSKTLDKQGQESYHSATMKLMYLGKRSRPDILTAISFLATRVKEPTEQDQDKLRRVLGYINHTKHLQLTLEADKAMTILVHIDAAHGVHKDMKGHTGGTISLGRGTVLSKSAKQKLTAKSSCEAEIIGVSDFLSLTLQLFNLLQEIGYKIGPVRLFQDNTSAIKLFERGRPASDATRHIAIRFFFAKDHVDNGELTIVHCPTEDMLADILTKPLVGRKFLQHRHNLLNLPGKLDNRGVLREDFDE